MEATTMKREHQLKYIGAEHNLIGKCSCNMAAFLALDAMGSRRKDIQKAFKQHCKDEAEFIRAFTENKHGELA